MHETLSTRPSVFIQPLTPRTSKPRASSPAPAVRPADSGRVAGVPRLAGGANEEAVKKESWQEYYQSLKGEPENRKGFKLEGPDAGACVHFEPRAADHVASRLRTRTLEHRREMPAPREGGLRDHGEL